jgi:hypothetical protein
VRRDLTPLNGQKKGHSGRGTTPARAKAAKVAANEGSGSLDKSAIWTPSNVRQAKLQRFNPLRGFSPARLVQLLESFDAGYLSGAAQLWEAMARRDGILSSVKFKREAAVALRSWGIRSTEEATSDKSLEAEAESQKQRLKFFWNNLQVTSAYDRNVKGGFAKFVDFAMQAQSYRYGAFHIVWRPLARGLTATLEHVPLQFFENLTGELRYLGSNLARTEGEALDPTNWLVLSGQGCMEPASAGYCFKHLAFNDLMSYCERYGMPFPVGETSSQPNSPEWAAMEQALDHIVNEGSAVIGAGAKISLLEASQSGELPMKVMMDYVDRTFSVIYRGANLSTISQEGGKGASVQGNESLIVEAYDCAFVSEVMQQLEAKVLAYYDGEGIETLAYGALKGPNLRDTRLEMDLDRFLVEHGAQLSQRDALERYQREAAADDEEVLHVGGKAEGLGLEAGGKQEAENGKPEVEGGVAVNAFNPAQLRDRQGRWTAGYGVPTATEQAALKPDFEQFAAFYAEPEEGQDEAVITVTPEQFADFTALAADRQREKNLVDTFSADNVETWPLPREQRAMAQSLEAQLLLDHNVDLGDRAIATQVLGTNAGEQQRQQLVQLRKLAVARRNEARKNVKAITREIDKRLADLGTEIEAEDLETFFQDAGFLKAATRLHKPIDAFDGTPVANNAKPEPEPSEPASFATVHAAVMADLQPVLTRLKQALKDDDLTLLEGLDEPALVKRVLEGQSTEQALLGLLGQTFAQSVNLPGLIDEVLAEQQAGAKANDE